MTNTSTPERALGSRKRRAVVRLAAGCAGGDALQDSQEGRAEAESPASTSGASYPVPEVAREALVRPLG